MLGLLISIFLINSIALMTVKRLKKSHAVHMCLFTVYFHLIVDLFLSYKYGGYWYFHHAIEWTDLLALTLLSPPAMLIFLDRFPFHVSFLKRLFYILIWSLILVVYEALTLLPEPWGFFRHGWWRLGYSAVLYPLLFAFALFYYRWICRIEKNEYRQK